MRREDEGPDPQWLEEEAARRREVWERGSTARRAARQQAREREPLFRRVHRLEVQLALTSPLEAARIAGGGGGSGPGSKLPNPVTQTYGGEHPAELARTWRLLADVVRRLEGMADGSAANGREPLITEDADRLLLSLEGYTPEEASSLEPRLGSPEAVRRARRRLERSAKDGAKV